MFFTAVRSQGIWLFGCLLSPAHFPHYLTDILTVLIWGCKALPSADLHPSCITQYSAAFGLNKEDTYVVWRPAHGLSWGLSVSWYTKKVLWLLQVHLVLLLPHRLRAVGVENYFDIGQYSSHIRWFRGRSKGLLSSTLSGLLLMLAWGFKILNGHVYIKNTTSAFLCYQRCFLEWIWA